MQPCINHKCPSSVKNRATCMWYSATIYNYWCNVCYNHGANDHVPCNIIPCACGILPYCTYCMIVCEKMTVCKTFSE